MRKSRILITAILISLSLFLLCLSAAQDGEDEGDGVGIYTEESTPSDPHEPDIIWSVAWSPDGSKVAYGIGASQCNLSNNEYFVRVVDPGSSAILTNLATNSTCPITELDWSPDNTMILGGNKNHVAVWLVSNGNLLSNINTAIELDPFIDHDWSPNGSHIASISSANHIVRIWDPLTGAETNSFDMQGDYSTSLTWNNDSIRIALGSSTIEIWDTTTSTQIQPIFDHTASKISWGPDGASIVGIVSNSSQIRIFDVTTSGIIHTFQGHSDTINQVVWRPDSKAVASASSDGTVRVWDISTGEQIAIFQYPGRVYAVDWSPDGSQLVFGGITSNGQDAQLQLADAPSTVSCDLTISLADTTSLISAITSANGAGTPQTLCLTASTYTLDTAPTITGEIIIVGDGATIEFPSGSGFNVSEGGKLTLRDVLLATSGSE